MSYLYIMVTIQYCQFDKESCLLPLLLRSHLLKITHSRFSRLRQEKPGKKAARLRPAAGRLMNWTAYRESLLGIKQIV